MPRAWGPRADELSREAIAEERPTSWFERLYAEGVAGRIDMPWDRVVPHERLVSWLGDASAGAGATAAVVGCGLGADAEFLASRGFRTTGFDLSPTAIAQAKERSAARPAGHAPVRYRVADLLALPDDMVGSFDLVVEIYTLQALSDPPRTEAAAGVLSLVRPGGRLFAVQFSDVGVEESERSVGPPFPLSQAFLEGLGTGGLTLVDLQLHGDLWAAEYVR